jgi:hypothetical protein
MIRSKSFLAILSTSTLCHAMVQPGVDTTPYPIHMAVRYTTPRGIGYNSGYTTLEGFFTSIVDTYYLPFLDLRGHVFDNGRFAVNAGAGFRYLTLDRTYGINVYYDYRSTKHQHYNQVALGLETLGEVWDARLNGYLPVGKKQSSLYDTEFDGFQGNYFYLESRREFAMKAANAEVGLYIDNYDPALLYFAAGPYYLNGKGPSAWGGEFRARADLRGLLRLEANVSYDHIFRWIGQGQISLNVAFGKKYETKRSSCKERGFDARAMQRVDRSEIIPVDKEHVRSIAIDPTTGNPYFFVFVDNTSSSLGTYESPYATLAVAEARSLPGQILYLFPGDGTSKGMDLGITLQDSQWLMGSSSTQQMKTTLGTITIPPATTKPPVITNTLAGPVITLANNNTVSGLYIENNVGSGIFGDTVTNFTMTQNMVIGGALGEAVVLNDVTGTWTSVDNLFVQTGPSSASTYAVHMQNSLGHVKASFTGDLFTLQPNGNNVSGIFIELSNDAALDSLTISGNEFSNTAAQGGAIEVTSTDNSSVGTITLADSTISDFSIGLEVDVYNNSTVGVVSVTNTHLKKIGYAGFYADVESTASLEGLSIDRSSVATSGTYGIVTYQGGAGTLGFLEVSKSNFSGCVYGINPELGGSGALTSLTVTDCNLSQNTWGVYLSLMATAPVESFAIASCTFDNNIGAAINFDFAANTTVGKVVVEKSSIVASEYGILSSLDGTIGAFTISDTTFSSNEFAISLQNEAIPRFNLLNSTFQGNTNGISSNNFPAVETGVISNNQFIGSYNQAITMTMLPSSTNAFSITDNQFTGVSAIVGSPIQGYGVSLTTSGGSSLCLEFTGNIATPTISGIYTPYLFDGSTGTFNLTSDTTQANNIGVITETGTFGSCSQ